MASGSLRPLRQTARSQDRLTGAIPLVATVVLETDHDCLVDERLDALGQIIDHLSRIKGGKPIVALFPAGWFEVSSSPTEGDLDRTVTTIRDLLPPASSVSVTFGIDGRGGRDQLAAAVTTEGLVALARKFHAAGDEDPAVLADHWLAGEQGLPRIARMFDTDFFLAVCYDCFGPKHLGLPPPGAAAVLVHTHGFRRRGEPLSGDVQFARKGIAGLARHWRLPVFAGAVFSGRPCPPRWPSGVMVRDSNMTEWTYEQNGLAPDDEITVETDSGRAIVRAFAF